MKASSNSQRQQQPNPRFLRALQGVPYAAIQRIYQQRGQATFSKMWPCDYTDKHDGVRTPQQPRSVFASGRLIAPGFKNISGYAARANAPQHHNTFCFFYTASSKWSADAKRPETFAPGERELYIQNVVTEPSWQRWTTASSASRIRQEGAREQGGPQAWLGTFSRRCGFGRPAHGQTRFGQERVK